MQTAKMMYYPFVHPPRPVLWQALLYWDALTSIAPLEGYQLGPELEELQDRELYQPVHVDDLPFQRRAALIDREDVNSASGPASAVLAWCGRKV